MKLSKDLFLRKYSEYLKGHHARCKSWCITYNTFDDDCELYGEHKYTPSTCLYFMESAYGDYIKGEINNEFVKELIFNEIKNTTI